MTKEANLKKRYGMLLETYDDMLEVQGGSCAICKKSTPLEVDHSHTTGAVRGLLCQRCNAMIGMSGDDSALLAAAAAYLAEYTL